MLVCKAVGNQVQLLHSEDATLRCAGIRTLIEVAQEGH